MTPVHLSQIFLHLGSSLHFITPLLFTLQNDHDLKKGFRQIVSFFLLHLD